MKADIFGQKGVTLIELMVAMAIAGIVAAAMFAFQQAQTRSYVTQEVVTNMQQNARAAMHFMTSEIRMAGCDPTGNANARILEASSDRLEFSMDFSSPPESSDSDDEDNSISYPVIELDFGTEDSHTFVFGLPYGSTNQPGEHITYALEANGDLTREDHNSDTSAVIAQNIDALDFLYLDEDGARIGGAADDLGPNDRANIRSIQVTVLARSDVPGFMYRHTDTQTYTNPAGEPLVDPNPPNDNVRRILLSTEARLRNR